MIRLAGAALLSAGAAGLGLGAAAELSGRVRDLRGLLTGLSAMGRALEGRLSPLEEMLAAAAECTADRPRDFFLFCGEGLSGGRSGRFGGLWEAALEEVPLRLEPPDLDILRPLGSVLGRWDADSQARALSQAAEQLGRQLSLAEERRGRLGRVYAVLGASAGLFLAILLL